MDKDSQLIYEAYKENKKAPAKGLKEGQTLCPKCGGIKMIVKDGKEIPSKEWPRHGVAWDAGCIC